MATVAELINLGACGTGDALGFNTDKGCSALLEAAHSIWLMPPSAFFDPSEDLDLNYIQTLQQAGNLIIIKKVAAFTENGNDDAIETLEDDTQLLTNKGKYKFLATFANDLYFNQALNSVEGQGNWRTIIVDNKGDIIMTERQAGGSKGFTTGMIRAAKLQFATNTTGIKQGLEFQLLERFEVDEDFVLFQRENLPFDPRQVDPIAQAAVSFASTPANTNTTLSVKVVSARGNQDAVTGLAVADFAYTNSTTANTITNVAYDTGTELYTLTVAALSTNDVITLKLDGVRSVSGDGLYKSNTANATVVT